MSAMTTPDVRRWTGVSAIAVAVFLALESITKLTMGPRPELDSSDALTAYTQATAAQTIIVILADTFLMAFLIVFLGAFRQLVNKARPDLEWIADITFGAGLVFIAVTLVGDAMDGGAALDVIGLTPDPSVIRALILGHSIMFGSTGAVLLALVSATAAYLTFASGVVPRWTGVLATVTALSNLSWAIVGFNGTSPKQLLRGRRLRQRHPGDLPVVGVGGVRRRYDRARRPPRHEPVGRADGGRAAGRLATAAREPRRSRAGAPAPRRARTG